MSASSYRNFKFHVVVLPNDLLMNHFSADEFVDQCMWLTNSVGKFGEDWTYHQSKFWFKNDEDLSAFKIRFE